VPGKIVMMFRPLLARFIVAVVVVGVRLMRVWDRRGVVVRVMIRVPVIGMVVWKYLVDVQ
jgi:hypothetical protein